MRLIPLTQGKFALVDNDDLALLSKWKWCYSKGYAVRSFVKQDGKRALIAMHTALMIPPFGMEVDHRDGDGLNNQRSNLRLATHQQNLCNKSAQKNSASGIKGVSWCESRNKWAAFIRHNGKTKNLGRFANRADAINAYNVAAIKAQGEFARPNGKS